MSRAYRGRRVGTEHGSAAALGGAVWVRWRVERFVGARSNNPGCFPFPLTVDSEALHTCVRHRRSGFVVVQAMGERRPYGCWILKVRLWGSVGMARVGLWQPRCVRAGAGLYMPNCILPALLPRAEGRRGARRQRPQALTASASWQHCVAPLHRTSQKLHRSWWFVSHMAVRCVTVSSLLPVCILT